MNYSGGQGWIRTIVNRSWQIYSLLPLTTRAPTHNIIFGDPGRSRTCDPLIRSQILYPAELQSHNKTTIKFQNTQSNIFPL